MGELAAFFARPLVKFGGVALLIILAVVAFQLWLSDMENSARRDGVTQERAAGFQHTLNQMEKANEVRRDVRDERSSARYDECLHSARTRENCKRYLPE